MSPVAPTTRSLAAPLWDAAAREPAAVAVIDRDESCTYAELRDRAAAIAAHLVAGGLAPGDRVAVFLPRDAWAAAAFFGVAAAGGAPTFINDRLRPRQVEHVLTDSGARFLLTSAELMAQQPRALETPVPIIDLGALRAGPGSASMPAPVAPRRDAVALVVYTSGSTGLPKGVAFGADAVHFAINSVAGYLGLRREDRIASLLAFSSVYGLNQLLCSVQVGARLLIDHSPMPSEILSWLMGEGVTVIAGVPPLWAQLLSAPAMASPIPTLRQMQSAGGHLPVEHVRRLRAAQPQADLVLQYGMTEVFRTTYLDPSEIDRRPDSMGKAMPGVEVLVLRDDATPCGPDEVGELVHVGPTIANGYWGRPEATARVFRPHPFDATLPPVVYSGDMVRRDADGFLRYVSRRDRLIKTLGFRVGPDEVADALHGSGQIADVLIDSEPDAQRGERIIAYVVLALGGTLEALVQYARVELPRHLQPTRFEVRDQIPRLASGKYDLAAVRESRARA
jgi:acyl-CoA synthetase (AMP-forming)/AMP-acid ligase II